VLDARQLPGGFVYKQVDRILIAEPVAARDRIVEVVIETVIVLDDSGGTIG
jgi:hypothetical protein